MKQILILFIFAFPLFSQRHDILIRNGMIYDGSGKKPYVADIAINGKQIVAIGILKNAKAKEVIDAKGLAVSPGFINMLSWANETLIEDGRSLSGLTQGVTLEVMGEGWSMGPLNEKLKQETMEAMGDIKYTIDWTTLGQYLSSLERRGISTNVASFVGAATVRIDVLDYENRAPSSKELEEMKSLVRQAMEEGAFGVASSLIYAPAFYAKTDELVELCKVAAEYDGMYISHLRSEGNRFSEAVDELLTIARDANIRSEIYHLKAAGKSNWNKLDGVIRKVEEARMSGLKITADMYLYTAGATGLDASMPPWVQEGGQKEWEKRLKDPAIRTQLQKEMTAQSNEWESLYLAAGSPEKVILVSFKQDSLKYLTGKTVAEVSVIRGTTPEETIMDLIVDDNSRVEAVYFLMSEENVRKQIALSWMSFGSDAGSLAPEGVFLKSNVHPRAYGNVARLLGKYVRDEKIIPLEEAIRKLTSLPASNLGITDRGMLKKGNFADIVVFDPATIQDHATFDKPHQLSTGVVHVFVNGTQVLKNGEHTGAKPGMAVRKKIGKKITK